MGSLTSSLVPEDDAVWLSAGTFLFFDAALFAMGLRSNFRPLSGRQVLLTTTVVLLMQGQLLASSLMRVYGAPCFSQWAVQYVMLMTALLAYAVRAAVLWFRVELGHETMQWYDNHIIAFTGGVGGTTAGGPGGGTAEEEYTFFPPQDLSGNESAEKSASKVPASSSSSALVYRDDLSDFDDGAADAFGPSKGADADRRDALNPAGTYYYDRRHWLRWYFVALVFAMLWLLEVVVLCVVVALWQPDDSSAYCGGGTAKSVLMAMWWVHALVFGAIAVTYRSAEDFRYVSTELRASTAVALGAFVAMSASEPNSYVFFFFGQWVPFLVLGVTMVVLPTMLTVPCCRRIVGDRGAAPERGDTAGPPTPGVAGQRAGEISPRRKAHNRDHSSGQMSEGDRHEVEMAAAAEAAARQHEVRGDEEEEEEKEQGGKDEEDGAAALPLPVQPQEEENEDCSLAVGSTARFRLLPGLLAAADTSRDAAEAGAWIEGTVEAERTSDQGRRFVLVRGRSTGFPRTALALWVAADLRSHVGPGQPGEAREKSDAMVAADAEAGGPPLRMSLRRSWADNRFRVPGLFADDDIARGTVLLRHNPGSIADERNGRSSTYSLAALVRHRWLESKHPYGAANAFFDSNGDVLAIRDVAADEEVLADYGFPYWLETLCEAKEEDLEEEQLQRIKARIMDSMPESRLPRPVPLMTPSVPPRKRLTHPVLQRAVSSPRSPRGRPRGPGSRPNSSPAALQRRPNAAAHPLDGVVAPPSALPGRRRPARIVAKARGGASNEEKRAFGDGGDDDDDDDDDERRAGDDDGHDHDAVVAALEQGAGGGYHSPRAAVLFQHHRRAASMAGIDDEVEQQVLSRYEARRGHYWLLNTTNWKAILLLLVIMILLLVSLVLSGNLSSG